MTKGRANFSLSSPERPLRRDPIWDKPGYYRRTNCFEIWEKCISDRDAPSTKSFSCKWRWMLEKGSGMKSISWWYEILQFIITKPAFQEMVENSSNSNKKAKEFKTLSKVVKRKLQLQNTLLNSYRVKVKGKKQWNYYTYFNLVMNSQFKKG